MNYLLKSWRSRLLLSGLSATIALTGCSNIQGVGSSDTPTHPIHSTEHNHSVPSDNIFTKCPPYNPEQTMCTAQYDPVCVTIKTDAGLNYRTAGNSCSACGTTPALGYVKGQCS